MEIEPVDKDLPFRVAPFSLYARPGAGSDARSLSAEPVLNREVTDALRLCLLLVPVPLPMKMPVARPEEGENVFTCVTSGCANETDRRAGRREVGEKMLYFNDCGR